jgi:NADPH-dependent 2,4-dienoyl-CoA reductase/sulfur reductase-like enzyme
VELRAGTAHQGRVAGGLLVSAGPLTENDHVLIVGAGLAGLRTAQGLRDGDFAGRITMVGDENHPPYDRPPLSKQIASGKWQAERAVLMGEERRAELNVDLIQGDAATGLDPDAMTVTFASGAVRAADRIVIATGTSARHLPAPDGVRPLYLRTLEDGVALADALGGGTPLQVVVIGAGFIGAEVATTAADLGHSVTVIEAQEIPLSTILGPELGAICGRLHASKGVTLRTATSVDHIAEGPRTPHGATVHLTSGEVLTADLLVVGIGVVPNTGWLEGSGLKLENGVVVDDRLFATDTILAVGDVARFAWHALGTVTPTRIEHWQVAADHGATAAHSLLAGREKAQPAAILPYFWSDQYGVKLQMLGRPAPGDTVEIVLGSEEEGSLLALYTRGNLVSAAFAISKPRQLMQLRAAMLAGCTKAEALAVLGL